MLYIQLVSQLKFKFFSALYTNCLHSSSSPSTILRRFPAIGAVVIITALAHVRARTIYPGYSQQLDIVAFTIYGCLLYVGLLRPTLVYLADKRLAPLIDRFLRTVSPNRSPVDSPNIATGIAFAIIGIIGLIFYLLTIDFFGHEKLEPGTFGDFFGGVLNPLLTFLTFVALAVTMAMQRAQLQTAISDSTAAVYQASLQRFETTFFNLLDLHNTIVRDLHFFPGEILLDHEKPDLEEGYEARRRGSRGCSLLSGEAQGITGRRVFAVILETIEEKVHGRNPYGIELTPPAAYKVIQDDYNHLLGHYFRNLFQALSLIDIYAKRLIDIGDADSFTPKRYSNLLRAQLSTNELTLLFFNCLENMVDNGRFRELLIDYKMLEHMSFDYSSILGSVRPIGYDLNIRSEVRQYLVPSSKEGVEQISSGAFGSNPKIKKFIDKENRERKNESQIID